MIALVVIAAFALVVVVATWSRHTTSRAERRSVQSYGRTLDVLGELAKRSDHPVSGEEAEPPGRSHVRSPEGDDRLRPVASAPSLPPARVRLQPPSPRWVEAMLGEESDEVIAVPASADDQQGAPEEPLTEVVQVVFDDASPLDELPEGDARELRGLRPGREHVLRRAATGAAAAVALAAFGVGGYELAQGRTSPAPSAPKPARRSSSSSGSRSTPDGRAASRRHQRRTTPPSTSTPSKPSAIEPTSTSGSVVAYAVPTRSYTIQFTVTGSSPCWLGVEQTPGGPYLWMDTLQPGASTTYKASGALVVRVGAPPMIAVQINGKKVALPPGVVQPFDMTLSPASQASA